ncbi:maestro heat-like repeat-containing protein family member 2B [Alligator mississippiensis]|uniref:maestro heat-like repeat-containing protein family member 2B n=1 Tax=Alligator mississippiensis TaxID=8496 RepID=UPI002877CBC4|nr:maestro heat-like repeat-containing protein family member 2B [Alligator mississippiensis]
MSQKKCAVVKAMRCMLGDQSTEVKKAVLHFVRTLLSVQGLDDWAWDLVAYIFKQSSLSRSQMKSKNRSSQDAKEEQSIRITCVEILENLDVSISGMSQVLWPRLLEYIVPAEYSCTLTPLCRCLGDLAEQPQWEGEEAACMDPSKGGLKSRSLWFEPAPPAS